MAVAKVSPGFYFSSVSVRLYFRDRGRRFLLLPFENFPAFGGVISLLKEKGGETREEIECRSVLVVDGGSAGRQRSGGTSASG